MSVRVEQTVGRRIRPSPREQRTRARRRLAPAAGSDGRRSAVRWGAPLVLVALIARYLVMPQLRKAHHVLPLLRQVNVGFLVIGIALGVASLLAYALLTRTLLLTTSAVSLSGVTRVQAALRSTRAFRLA